MAAYRDVIRAWFALCILRIVVKLAVIKDIPAISLLDLVFLVFLIDIRGARGEGNAVVRGDFGSIPLACFIAQPECDYLPAEHTQAANALAV